MAKFEEEFKAGVKKDMLTIQLDDGRKITVHPDWQYPVEENNDLHTVREIMDNDWTIKI